MLRRIAFWRRGIPLPIFVMALVITMIGLVSLSNLGFLFRESSLLGRSYATESFSLSTKATLRTIKGQIEPVLASIATSAAFDFRPSGKSVDDFNSALLFNCIQLLTSHSNLLAANFGYADGSFYSVTNLYDDKVRERYKAPHGAVYAIWAVAADPADGTMREYWSFLDQEYRQLEMRIETPDYDPRTKTWYLTAMNAGSLSMTEPYVFTTSQELGTAVAAPLSNGLGVFSVNMMLRNFDAVLAEVPLPEGSYLFLLDGAGRIVSERMPAKVQKTTPMLSTLADHPLSAVASAAPHLKACIQQGEAVSVDVNGREYFMACQRIAMGTRELDVLMMAPVDQFMQLIRSFLLNSTLFSLGSLVFFVLLGGWLALRIGQTLTRLLRETLHVRQLSDADNASVSSPVFEVRRLAHAIAGLKRSVQTRTNALRKTRDSLEQTVSERTAELVQARDDAQAATKVKSTFLSTVSHEIRTPMNAIVGFTYLFETENLSTQQRDYLEKIRISSETLLHIINDVLDLSKIEAGRLELEIIPFRLRAMLDTVCSIIRFSAENKGLVLQVEADDDVPDLLNGDPTRLHQILLNLMNNAVKFTASGTVRLHVSLRPDHDATHKARTHERRTCEHPTPPDGIEQRSGADRREAVPLVFRVSDTGIGMNEEHLARLFVPFSQADNSISRRYGGTGLGLAICHQLVHMMDGSIEVSSQAGTGTTFAVELNLQSGRGSNPNEVETEHAGAWRHDAQVLVVDDNEINREIIGALLERSGLHVSFAEDGAQAIEEIRRTRYDLVFMDMQMPVMDGLEATRRIRELGEQGIVPSALPIVAMTANAMTEDRVRCLKAGMNDHVSKPLVPEVVFAKLAHWLPAE